MLAIEKVWSAAKAYYNKRILAIRDEIDEERFRVLVKESLRQLTPAKIDSLTRSNYGYISSLLRQQLAV